MTWVRLDDRFDDNAKVNEASNAAMGVYAKCLTWSARNRRDGFVPLGVARNKAGADGQAVLDELVRVRLWVECEGGYRAPDFLDFNPSAAEVEARQAKKAEAGKRGARARWNRPDAPPAIAPPMAGAIAPAWQNDAPVSRIPENVVGSLERSSGTETQSSPASLVGAPAAPPPKRQRPVARPDALPLPGTDARAIHDAIVADANLIAMCAECNLGLGAQSLEATIYAALLARQDHAPANDDGEGGDA